MRDTNYYHYRLCIWFAGDYVDRATSEIDIVSVFVRALLSILSTKVHSSAEYTSAGAARNLKCVDSRLLM